MPPILALQFRQVALGSRINLQRHRAHLIFGLFSPAHFHRRSRRILRVLLRIVPTDFAIQFRPLRQQNRILKKVPILPREIPIFYLQQNLHRTIGKRRRHLHGLANVVRVCPDADRFNIHRQHKRIAHREILLSRCNVQRREKPISNRKLHIGQRVFRSLFREVKPHSGLLRLRLADRVKVVLKHQVGPFRQAQRQAPRQQMRLRPDSNTTQRHHIAIDSHTAGRVRVLCRLHPLRILGTVGEIQHVMNHLARRGTKLNRLYPLVLRQIQCNPQVTVNVGAFRRHRKCFVHFHNQVRRTKLPPRSEFRRRRCTGALALRHAQLHPRLNRFQVSLTQPPPILVSIRRRFGLPGRHNARRRHCGNKLAMLSNIRVVHQAEGRSFALTMAP